MPFVSPSVAARSLIMGGTLTFLGSFLLLCVGVRGSSIHCWVSERARSSLAASCLCLRLWVSVGWCVLFENCIVDASINFCSSFLVQWFLFL